VIRFKNYVKAESLEEAYNLNQKKSSVIGAGMMWLKVQSRIKMTLVDLSGLGLEGIEETDDEFVIGAMCTLRQLEIHKGLDGYFPGLFKECTRFIVGIQFRNGATVGGSIYGRFGFSDILTCMLALDTYVELYKGGIIPLEEFVKQKFNRDILVRIRIKKDGRRAFYASSRMTKTDFPLLACCVSATDDTYYVSVGARPAKAELAVISRKEGTDLKELAALAADRFRYGTNFRGSAEYRKHLTEVYVKRLFMALDREEG
jgi:CO/xanthine dehydrogenase FAD-binding subunit